MPDREKVIRSIDCITRNAQDKPCNGCMCFRPFTDDPDTGWCDRNAALKDALKLLRRYNAEDAHAAIMDAPTVGGWISVNERLPEKPGRYLVCTSTITKVAWFLLSLKANPQFEYEMQGEPDRPGFFDGDSEGDWVQDDMTHWMVLPERPKGEE